MKTVASCETMPEVQELYRLGMAKIARKSQRQSILWFDLRLTSNWANWKGKLIVDWPGSDRAWARWANKPKNIFAIHAIRESSAFDADMPSWDRLILKWDQLQVLPNRWKAKLSEWRGIYYIFDTVLGQGYVGSAYGAENILGRWINYAASGHGGNQLLTKRDPKDFLFSILQRLSPDSLPEEVIHCESTWKERLHTRTPSGLNDN